MAALVFQSQDQIGEFGFLESASPSIAEAIARAIAKGATAIVVLPALLNAAHHVKIDIPIIIQAAKQQYPAIPILYGRPLDLHPKISALYQLRIREALLEDPAVNAKETALIIVGRGTSDSTANENVLKLKQMMQKELNFETILHGYTSIAKPLLPEVLHALPHRTILIAPYLLFEGVLAGKIASVAQSFRENNRDRRLIVARTLGSHALARDAFLDRLREAVGLLGHLLENEENANPHEEKGKDTT